MLPMALAVLVLTGCGVQLAGSAAVIGDERITERELTAQIEELQTSFEGDSPPVINEQVARAILARLIVNQIVVEAAAAEDISVTDSEVAQERVAIEEAFGGETPLLQFAAGQGLAPNMIDGALRTDLLVTRLGQKLSPGVEPALQQEVAFAFVTEYSKSINIEVSPRIGVWVSDDFSIAPPPNDLSVPAN
jgi:hypothetical protein